MRALRLLPVAIVTAMFLSINAPISFAVSSQNGGAFCAREVPSGSIVDASAGTITFPNGSVVASANMPCSMTSVVFSCCSNGPLVYGSEGALNVNQYFASFQDQWTSPPNPSGSLGSNQAVALWDGLSYYSSNHDIVQPVLIYGCIITSDCSSSWRFTAYAIIGGIIDYATPVSTGNGDTVQGVMTYYSSIMGCIGNGPGYGINAKDGSAHSTLYQCTSDQYPFAYAGALEPINLTTCTQMPGTTSDAFGSISYTTGNPSGGTATAGTGGNGNTFCSGTHSWNSGHTTLTLGWRDS
jgi:hypothetical protein